MYYIARFYQKGTQTVYPQKATCCYNSINMTGGVICSRASWERGALEQGIMGDQIRSSPEVVQADMGVA